MQAGSWFSLLSVRQKGWLLAAVVGMVSILVAGVLLEPPQERAAQVELDPGMSIREIAPKLSVTGKALARELDLPLDVSKRAPLRTLGVTAEDLRHTSEHLLSHRHGTLKYYLYVALVLGGLVYLVRLGRPDLSDARRRKVWYPQAPYVGFLLASVLVAGFVFGKSPNPMEGAVKVFKSMVGLYPDPVVKAAAFLFFLALAVVGNKLICGWACPFGALQELLYRLPVLKAVKERKLPFVLTNTVRAGLFVTVLLVLFGVVGGRRGTVLYHHVNPFNLFDLHFENAFILLTVTVVLLGSLAAYRPFCQFVCPFGLLSWVAERFSLVRVRVDPDRCTRCGACTHACPLEAAKGRVAGKRWPADCFSCARCLKVCPEDAIRYAPVWQGAGARRSGPSSPAPAARP